MLIREGGILFQGIPIIFKSFHRASKEKTNLICSSGLLGGLLGFAECLMEPIEYFESDKYSIVFKKKTMVDLYKQKQELLAYIVLDKDERLEKYLHKSILPLLEKMLKRFVSKYSGCNLSRVNQFNAFEKVIDRVFGVNTQTLKERVDSLLA
ncbi:MAG: hypothetical protein ACFFC3_11130 [Candidatus Odinarchaeota archaeon]